MDKLIAVMDKLRSPGGCPWDAEQTHQSLLPYLLEETQELIDAIHSGDSSQLKEELGDFLLQAIFHARIAEDTFGFNIQDVAQTITEKLIRRHPHVFSDTQVNSIEQVADNWEKIKKAEKGETSKSYLSDIPRSAPALLEAYLLGRKAAKKGLKGNFSELNQLLERFQSCLKEKKETDLFDKAGDLLFALVGFMRDARIHPELSLKSANRKFRYHFEKIEKLIKNNKISTENLTDQEWRKLWEDIKNEV